MIPDYWWPFMYQYGVGCLLFVAGLVIALYEGALVLSRAQDRNWFVLVILGFCWYVAIHLSWYLAAIYINPQPA